MSPSFQKRSTGPISNKASSPAITRLKTLGFNIELSGIPEFLGGLTEARPAQALHRKSQTQRAVSKNRSNGTLAMAGSHT
jgi:hypothetical protein